MMFLVNSQFLILLLEILVFISCLYLKFDLVWQLILNKNVDKADVENHDADEKCIIAMLVFHCGIGLPGSMEERKKHNWLSSFCL